MCVALVRVLPPLVGIITLFLLLGRKKEFPVQRCLAVCALNRIPCVRFTPPPKHIRVRVLLWHVQMHDELVFEVAEDRVHEVAAMIKVTMEKAELQNVRTPVTIKVGSVLLAHARGSTLGGSKGLE